MHTLRQRKILTACVHSTLTMLCALAFALSVSAQSSDVDSPTPVTSEEVNGRILPRDIGDPRRTTYFYLFKGKRGDIALNVESRNLDGDIDLFTADDLRPLMKIVVYGGDELSRVEKSIYLRRDDALILRVQARSIGDADGTFRIGFSGAFAPADDALIAKYTKSAPPPVVTARNTKGAQRVTSTGALIRETPATTTETDSNEATNANRADSQTSNQAQTARNDAAPTSNRNANGARNSNVNNQASNAPPAASSSDVSVAANNSNAETASTNSPAPVTTASAKPKTSNSSSARTSKNSTTRTKSNAPRNSTRTNPTRTNSATPATAASTRNPNSANRRGASASGVRTLGAETARLILVMRDGSRIEREMIDVQRVSVEDGNLIIIAKDGQMTSRPLAEIVRMSIEP